LIGEAYPPTPDRILKFTRDGCFTNKYTHAEAGLIISTPPPDRPDERQSECPRKLRDEIAIVTKGIFGKEFQGLEIDSYRICWCGIPHDLYGRNSLKLTVISLPRDAVTKNRDFLITPHPHCKGLYLATGGSFHGWKFLPIIGQYVAQMLEGALEEDLSRRWSWDRAPDPDMPDYQKPKRDWKDLRDDDESRSWWFTRAISSVFGLFWK
jgi:sarcosine oxidase/L-pipecolate oxidase